MALSKYDKEFMTEREQETVARLTKLYDEGKLDGASAHNAVENIRSKYGYSGGTDGSGYVATTGDADPAQAIYDRLVASERQSRGGSGGALEQLARMTYSDWKRGGEYEALQEMYRRNANQMSEDVIGQLSARTGGLASSYAAAAASQQYADVMSQLEAVARQMYEGDRGAAMDIYQLQQQAADKAYDRAMVERQYKDNRTLQQKQEAETGRADARDRVNAYLAAGGSAANLDRALLQQSGYTDAEIAAFEKYYAQQIAAANAKGKSTGGGVEKPRLTLAQTLEAIENGIINEQTLAAYEYYYGQPYNAEQKTEDGGGLLYEESVTRKNKGSLDYDEDEGIFVWNGKRYTSIDALQNDINEEINNGTLTQSEYDGIVRELERYGFTS